MIRFWEIFRCAGVDHDDRHRGMVMPLHGANFVGVQHDRQPVQLIPSTSALQVVEPADPSDIIRARVARNIELSQPGVDKALVDAYMPDTFWGDVRYFKVIGSRRLDASSGGKIKIVLKNKDVVSMPVLVLDTITIPIAIRNVMVYDQQGNQRSHATRTVDPAAEIKAMNAVWLPQTQMRFELVPSQPAVIDDRDPKVRARIQAALGIKDPAFASLSSVIEPSKLRGLFADHRVKGAAITFFVVQTIASGNSRPDGLALSPEGIAFIANTHGPTTFAHEAGHILGREKQAGNWVGHPHTYDIVVDEKTKQKRLSDEDYRMLMRDGGAGYKIPFDMVDRFRKFRP